MPAFTIGKALHSCVYPYPVYQAHFSDGTVGRMSFWSKYGKDFDFARGKRICETVFKKTVTNGFVEQDPHGKPWVRVRDPLFCDTAKPAKRRVQYKQLLADVLACIDTADNDNPVFQEARQALA